MGSSLVDLHNAGLINMELFAGLDARLSLLVIVFVGVSLMMVMRNLLLSFMLTIGAALFCVVLLWGLASDGVKAATGVDERGVWHRYNVRLEATNGKKVRAHI